MFRQSEKKESNGITKDQLLYHPQYYFPSRISRGNFLSIFEELTDKEKTGFLKAIGFSEETGAHDLDEKFYSAVIELKNVYDEAEGIHIQQREDEILSDPYEVVLPRRKYIRIRFVYPLEKNLTIPFEAKNEEGFTRRELVKFISQSYKEFYENPEHYGVYEEFDMEELILTFIKQDDDTLTLDIET